MDLKDKLKAWQRAHPDLEKDAATRTARVAEEGRRAAREAEAKAKREEEARAVAREQALTDEELFQRAVTDLGDGAVAILKKYDETDLPKRDGRAAVEGDAPAGEKLSDANLFLDAVRDVPRPRSGKKPR